MASKCQIGIAISQCTADNRPNPDAGYLGRSYRASRVLMAKRIVMAGVLTVLLVARGTFGPRAQQPTSPGQIYLWMPNTHPEMTFDLLHALGGAVSTNSSVG
jgi:hypothetical protein